MTRRWFSKLLTAAPLTAPLASKVVAEGLNSESLGENPWRNHSLNIMEKSGLIFPQGNPELYPRATAFPSTSSKSPHYKFLEKSLKALNEDKHKYYGVAPPPRKIHNCNPGYIPKVSGVDYNKQRFRMRYQSPGQKWDRDTAVKLWNLRRKTTLAEEWEATKNEIMEACSIEI